MGGMDPIDLLVVFTVHHTPRSYWNLLLNGPTQCRRGPSSTCMTNFDITIDMYQPN